MNQVSSTPQPVHVERQLRHTPLHINSNIHSSHTKDLSTVDKKTRQRRQRALQDILKHELHHATFEGEWVRETFCPAYNGADQKVFDNLMTGKTPVFARMLGTNEFVLRDWPEKTAGEASFYPVFVNILNSIINSFKTLYPSQYNKSVFCGTQFYVYDRTMLGSVAGEAAVKPDFLSCEIFIGNGVRISWYQASLVGEIKLDWSELVAQAGTYARCLFAASEHRIFIPMLCLNQSDGSFRLCIFHRSGLLATTPMNLTTEDGFREFVSTIVGLWQWDTLAKAGYETSLSHSHIGFNGLQYRINEVLCRRQVLCGRATSVYAVELDTDLKRRHRSQSRRYLPEFTEEFLQQVKKKTRVWSRLNPFDDLKSAPLSATTSLDSIKLPDTFIVKCSHQPAGREKEEDIFGSVQDYIGIPEILAGYEAEQIQIGGHTPVFWNVLRHEKARADEDSDDSDEELEDEDQTDEDAEGEEGEEVEEEVEEEAEEEEEEEEKHEGDARTGAGGHFQARVHRHLVIKTMGERLNVDMGPPAIVRALQHAVIGHCALFSEGGYLHRDVSNGNIIVLREAELRKIPSVLSSVVQSRECIAVLIDGDVAKKWGSVEQSTHRSGTLPFLSARVADLWDLEMPVSHTPIDDLESFIWVLLYELLRWTLKRTPIERRWWNELNADSVQTVARLKQAILPGWMDAELYHEFALSRFVAPFRGLLHEWFASVGSYSRKCTKLIGQTASEAELDALFKDAYVDFIRISAKHVPLLPRQFPGLKKKN
ncbi:hypothetical protein HGRIS_001449 [Hohenbuehelia grisea]|uniref:Fungal-type protein kinase domain-containing protein n=2 Tax=Hohenbuehelia grisea TaxID=104357 RepID=A0ABR3JQV6_9AGAR